MDFTIGSRTLTFDESTKNLVFNGKIIAPDIRTYEQMYDLYDYKDETLDKNFGMYFMYRGVYFSEAGKSRFENEHLRYDITILAPKSIGWEPNKTFGHFHPKNKDEKFYEEIYEVISGNAIYLQQNEEIVFFTRAKAGDKVVMVTSFGHLTINPSESEYLVMVNIVSSEFSSLYGAYKEKKGGEYYLKNGKWEKNQNYTSELPFVESFDILSWENIYDDFTHNPSKYNFLK